MSQKSLALASGKAKRFERFKEIIGSSSKSKMTAGLKGTLASLSFKDRKAIVEAMISPENGGKCVASYIRPLDFLDDEEFEGHVPR